MSGKDYYNPGIINTQALKDSFTKNGGTVESKEMADGRTHVTGHFNDKGRSDRISWNEDKNGNITDVHSTRNNGDHTNYKGGR